MDNTQIVLITLLAVVIFVTFLNLIRRMTDMNSEKLWIEPIIIIIAFLFMYLVGR